MFEKAQRDRFWLVLGAILIALFVMQKERGLAGTEPQQRQEVRVYDRGGMNRLVEKTIEIPTTARPVARPQYTQVAWNDDPYADLVTGSISSSAPKPLARPGRAAQGSVEVASLAAPSGRYYAQVGAYSSIDRASRRYFDVLGREPDLKPGERVAIDTARISGEEVHRVRMGPFASERSAQGACARAGISADECAIIHLN
ncbi:SPOR domain-containing protein [Parvibaculum sp.]|uniref:SPOR domain-containing protein n=1 Tax=Parvibaculum sp. TaxID=2024848 RepID=UPI0038B35196